MNELQRGLAELGNLLADDSRSAILLLLTDGRAYTATELARAADIANSTASHHLERMHSAGAIACIRQGRHRYYRIANETVAGFIEQALSTWSSLNVKAVTSRCPAHLRETRFCYNHLAGETAVRMLAAGLRRSVFTLTDEGIRPGPAASPLLTELGIDAETAPAGRHCLDWSERRFHVAGELGNLLADAMLERRWLLRGKGRELTMTLQGRQLFARHFDI